MIYIGILLFLLLLFFTYTQLSLLPYQMQRSLVSVFFYAILSVVSLFSGVEGFQGPRRSAMLHAFPTLKRSAGTTGTTLDKPKWAAKGIVSDVVNALISIKPLFAVMKLAARQTLIDTAEKKGVPWMETTKAFEKKRGVLEETYISLVNRSLSYPEYYTQEFHAYEEGNLNWKAAFECESATMSMALRVWPKEELTPLEAQERLRSSFIDAVRSYEPKLKSPQVKCILDVGCSVGVSTFYLAQAFPQAQKIIGLDLSPHFLSVAKHRQQSVMGDETALSSKFASIFSDSVLERINWVHGNAEKIPFPDCSFDIVPVSFMFHELPDEAANAIISELYRVCKIGGVVALTDNNPRSPVIQGLPPAIFTLMKSTEPWSDQYYVYNIEEALEEAGFVNVRTEETDPRHRTILATKP